MRAGGSETGIARGIWILVTVAALVGASLAAAGVWVSRFARPEAVSSRMERALGIPVSLDEVRVRPLALEAVLEGLTVGDAASVGSAVIRFDPASALAGKLEFRSVDLSRPIWRTPSSVEGTEAFAKALMLPFWAAARADVVTLSDGLLIGPGGHVELASAVRGRLARLPGGTSARRVEADLAGVVTKYGESSAHCVYSSTGRGDSVAVEEIRLSIGEFAFQGAGTVAAGAQHAVRAEVWSDEFYGGSIRLTARLLDGPQARELEARFSLRDCDGARLLREKFGLNLLVKGSLSGDFDARAGVGAWFNMGMKAIEAHGEARVSDAVLDPGGALAELLPLKAGVGDRNVESATARVALSGAGATAVDMVVESGETTWILVGTVGADRSIAGRVVGRVPAELIGAEGASLALLSALLADSEGRLPVAFAVGGSLDKPRVEFDLEATADEAAASGRPRAKQLVKAMSRSDLEKVSRMVDGVFRKL